MAKIKVTKVNPVEAIEKTASLFRMLGIDCSEIPATQDIWIDTRFIAQIDTILPDSLSGGAFLVHVTYLKEDLSISVKDYDRLLNAWKEEEK